MRNATKMETAYTYSEWCKLVDRHGKTILKRYIKRYIKRKLRTATRFIFRASVLYLAYAFCYAVAYQL